MQNKNMCESAMQYKVNRYDIGTVVYYRVFDE